MSLERIVQITGYSKVGEQDRTVHIDQQVCSLDIPLASQERVQNRA
jgi:hypothetical protein